ncbi:M48 family metalloprotease [Kineosporia sp. R_H_3]|uniref:M48 family metalloprotease n=1 Tax=Kineosporia sp. R_H_3 TaxID=1961848 RepID=UPI000B4AA95B|nr:M48 family metalloprotease [Kineosporia sp. R_H_3]
MTTLAGYGEALALTGLAAALLGPLPPLLARARWTARSPRTALTVWNVTAVGAAAATTTAVLSAAAVPTGLPPLTLLTETAAHGLPVLATLPPPHRALLGAGLLLGLVQAGVLAVGAANRSARRRAHVALLDLVADRDPEQDCLVLANDTAFAYSVPGQRRHPGVVVISTACRDLTDPRQLHAVLAHERAHLSGHHHLLLQPIRAWRSGLPLLPGPRTALEAATTLAEILADDAAARATSRQCVAAAIHQLGGGADTAWDPAPDSLVRLRRLLGSPRPLDPRAELLIRVTCVVVLLAPVLALSTGA